MSAPPLKDKSKLTCSKKKRYSDELTARAGCMTVLQQDPNNSPPKLWVYKCKECKGWHLTSNTQSWAGVTKDNPYTKKNPFILV